MTVTWLAPNTFVTFCKGMAMDVVVNIFEEAGRPLRAVGEDGGWVWVVQDAYIGPGPGVRESGQTGWDLARSITAVMGRHHHAQRAGDPERVETVFLASTPACACPHGQNYMIPHCAEHPFQFVYSRGGFERTLFNLGARRESRRSGGLADLLVRELLAAGIVGRDTPRYDSEPGFNADGAHTVRIIADHFALPSPPLEPGQRSP
ncbi:hypothetical protein PV396_41185 [Streptomyces sp. ME02-8801-2C]|uniref:hypothetical protein n=1 Tax=Streptomyces sp. ME02-8801-2C TaxID=3028680 RepID=UPI0029B7D2AA|nr:hypothetical protein [Streptomyces sp. ME02-8801-2C]MDX3458281.1 hypothetical protein [Streptomyces sp. ME02-8801-2C]